MELIWLVPAAGLIAVLFALWLVRDVLRRDTGSPQMQDIANRIVQGANAFLRRQYRTIALLSLAAAIIIGLLLGFLGQTDINGNGTIDLGDQVGLGWRTAVAFLVGAFCSAVAGFIGMYISVRANLRTASAAQRGVGEAIVTALRGGAVSGFLIVALSLLGVTAIFYAYGGANPERAAIVPFLLFLFCF